MQYHFGTEGVLQTFNFAGGTGHLLDQEYSICIRQETGNLYLRSRLSKGHREPLIEVSIFGKSMVGFEGPP